MQALISSIIHKGPTCRRTVTAQGSPPIFLGVNIHRTRDAISGVPSFYRPSLLVDASDIMGSRLASLTYLALFYPCHSLTLLPAPAVPLHPTLPGPHFARLPPARMMGRAEKRMAKKRSKKGSQYQGGRPMSRPGQSAATSDRNDMMPRDTVLARLREVPVFGLSGGSGSDATTESGFLTASDGMATLFMDSREAEKASSLSPGSRLKGVPLDEVYFDQSVRLKPSDSALKEATTVPNERALVANVKTPLFAIDGMQTTDKDTGVNSLPLFFSKAELLEFAIPVYGPDAAERVLITSLEAVVTNMVRGPAGLLRARPQRSIPSLGRTQDENG